jgi:allantoin racemase
MTNQRKRLLLIKPYSFPETSRYYEPVDDDRREAQVMNYEDVAPLLADVDWELHPGPTAPQGDGFVETREEFARVGVARLPIVRTACASGRYDAIVLLGGGDPGFIEAREIGQRTNTPVTACAHAQMHIAAMLGNKFSVIDVSEVHSMHTYNLVVQYRCVEKCASIRCLDFPMPREANPDLPPPGTEKAKAARGEQSEMLDRAITEAVAAIEHDGAETIICGCSETYWMQPYLQRELLRLGWEVPVLEGYRAAIGMAKLLAGLGVSVSGLAYPSDRPKQWRRRKTF